jgi:hypothetical protein
MQPCDPLKRKVRDCPELLEHRVRRNCPRRECRQRIELPKCPPRRDFCPPRRDFCPPRRDFCPPRRDFCPPRFDDSCSSSSSSSDDSCSSSSDSECCEEQCAVPHIQNITYNCCPPPPCMPVRRCRGAQGCKGLPLHTGYVPGLGWNYYSNVGWANPGCCSVPVFTGMWH